MLRFAHTLVVSATVAALAVAALPATASAGHPPNSPEVRELASFAAPGCMSGCGSGSTVGPDGALYVTDGPSGRVLRVDPRTGAVTTFASGLPAAIPAVGIGGAMDVAFVGPTAYVLVTLVGSEFGQDDVIAGIYRIKRDGSATEVADIGQWSIDNPPETDIFINSGVQYALQPYLGGFLVTDGHHNRVLWVTPRGHIFELKTFGNIVPTGLEVQGLRIFMGQAGPIPHLPENGKAVTFTPWSPAIDLASGASLIVDVEFGPGQRLYALSQGIWDLEPIPANEGAPASPNSGQLVRVGRSGSFTPVAGGLDRPTSLEFIRDTAYVVTLTGKVLKIR